VDPSLVAQVVSFLTPFLPYLLKAGKKAGEELAGEAGKKFGDAAWEGAKHLWGKLRPKIEERPAALEAVQEVANAPSDPDAQAAVRVQLKKILSADESFAAEIARLLEAAGPRTTYNAVLYGSGAIAQGNGNVVAGAGGVAVGGNVNGGITVDNRKRSLGRRDAEDEG
jgi:hypothetical protein